MFLKPSAIITYSIFDATIFGRELWMNYEWTMKTWGDGVFKQDKANVKEIWRASSCLTPASACELWRNYEETMKTDDFGRVICFLHLPLKTDLIYVWTSVSTLAIYGYVIILREKAIFCYFAALIFWPHTRKRPWRVQNACGRCWGPVTSIFIFDYLKLWAIRFLSSAESLFN